MSKTAMDPWQDNIQNRIDSTYKSRIEILKALDVTVVVISSAAIPAMITIMQKDGISQQCISSLKVASVFAFASIVLFIILYAMFASLTQIEMNKLAKMKTLDLPEEEGERLRESVNSLKPWYSFAEIIIRGALMSSFVLMILTMSSLIWQAS